MAIGEYPDANYTPTMAGYSGQGSFRFWCQTVLPLVYDDSLSYYELLNKVVTYLNNIISDVSNVETNVASLLDAYNSLQEYVNTYFDSLDVQEEINNKLDEMASDGSLNAIIDPVIAESVGDWLEENITPTTPAIDASLTVSGAGADAAVVGAKVNGALTHNGNTVSTEDINDVKFAHGGQWYVPTSGRPNRDGNFPFTTGAARIVTIGGDTDSITGKVQIVLSNTNEIVWRMGISNTWGSWSNLMRIAKLEDYVDGTLLYRGHATADDDINEGVFNKNGQWYVEANAHPNNFPFSSGAGRIITFARQDETGTGKIQLVFGYAGQCAWRFKYLNNNVETWSSWKLLADETEIEDINTNFFKANRASMTDNSATTDLTLPGSYSKASSITVTNLPTQKSGYIYNPNKISQSYQYYHDIYDEVWYKNGGRWNLASPGNSFGYRLAQKTIMGIGGSWVKQSSGSSVPESAQWFGLIVDKFAMTGYNNGLATSSFAKYNNENVPSVVERIPTIVTAHSNEPSDIENGTQYPGTNVDYIVLQGGGNDSTHNVPLGNLNSTTDTEYYGALNIIVNALRSTYPTARICFVTCFRRWVNDSSVSANGNDLGLFDEDYANALITFCRANSIPCYDAWHNSNIIGRWGTAENPNYWPYISSSNKHLNSAGNAYVAPIIAHFLNEI